MVFKKIIFQNRYVALETPSRPPPPFMAKAILNFHFDYLTPSLTYFICFILILFINGSKDGSLATVQQQHNKVAGLLFDPHWSGIRKKHLQTILSPSSTMLAVFPLSKC